jgi:hypothetical protein
VEDDIKRSWFWYELYLSIAWFMEKSKIVIIGRTVSRKSFCFIVIEHLAVL